MQVKTSEGLSKDKDLVKEHSAGFKELVKEHSAKEQLNLGSQERWIEQEDLAMVVVVQ